jgi:uncharacterized protein (TIGR03435 family)
MPKFAAFVAIIFAVTISPARGQIPETPGKTAPGVLTWDVVSIKPHKALDNNAMTQTLPDGFEMKNMGIHSVVSQAFPIRSGDEIVGWPEWTNSARFDFRAKMDAETAEAFHKLHGSDSSDMWRLMFRQLLEERMGLKYHMEKRELPVYDLVIAKHGPKLKVSAADEQSTSKSSPGWLSAQRTPANGLAGILSGIVGREVNDKTGLTGLYDIELNWQWNDDPGSGDTGPSIFTALQEQLGLKLEPAKAPVDVVVIDHLERPSEN